MPSGYTNAIVVASTALAALSTVFVALRFWSRRITAIPVGTDDWLTVSTLLVHHAALGLTFWVVFEGGLGQDYATAVAENPNATVNLLKGVYIYCFLYTISSPMIKFSVLSFYWRIFPTRTVQIGCSLIGLLTVLWFIGTFLGEMLICQPIAKNWDTTLPGHCVSSFAFYTANSAPNCVLDLLTLLLPFGEVLRLRVSRRRKLSICGVFLLGGIVVAASIARLVFLILSWELGVTSPTQQMVMPWLAANVEVYTAIIGACLPMMMPVWRKLTGANVAPAPSGAAAADKPVKNPIAPFSFKTIGQMTGRGRAPTDSYILGSYASEEQFLEESHEQEHSLVLTPVKETTQRESRVSGTCPVGNDEGAHGITVTQDTCIQMD